MKGSFLIAGAFWSLTACVLPSTQNVSAKGVSPAVALDPARVRISGFVNDERLVVTCLDGKRTYSYFGGWIGEDFPKEIDVDAGRHYLRVFYQARHGSRGENFWLDAEAGHQYELKKEMIGYGIRLWIADKRTLQPVGGVMGTEPEGPSLNSPCEINDKD